MFLDAALEFSNFEPGNVLHRTCSPPTLMLRGLVLVAYAIGALAQKAFNPRLYEQFKQKASCKALNRHGGEGVPDEVYIDISRFSSRAN